ncbi:MAG: hypothetical protein FWH11_10695 [Micrococcales bacterium]|nr:hypothetical protein [Micrococcales bacterium]
MHPTARRCLWAAVVLWVAGAALVGFAPTLYDLADGWLGGALSIAVGFLQEALVPTGAVLLGAAVVIQALRGTRPSSVAQVTPEGQASPVTGALPTAGPRPPTAPTPLAPPPSGAVPSAPPSSPVPVMSPLSSPVPAVPPLSGPVPTAGPGSGAATTAAPVLPGTGATQVAPERPPRGRQSRSRRGRA